MIPMLKKPMTQNDTPRKMSNVLYTRVCSNDDHCCIGVSWIFTSQR